MRKPERLQELYVEALAEIERLHATDHASAIRGLQSWLKDAIRERDEARAEVERLRGVDCGVTELDGTTTPLCGACLECAFLRGAEAMREAAASCVGGDIALLQTYRSVLERRIRDLPVPEER